MPAPRGLIAAVDGRPGANGAPGGRWALSAGAGAVWSAALRGWETSVA